MLNDRQLAGRLSGRTFKWQHRAEIGNIATEVDFVQKRENIRKSEISEILKRGAGGGVESLDLNGKMLEMKISTDMEMGTCLIRIEENWSAALRARLLLSISLLVS